MKIQYVESQKYLNLWSISQKIQKLTGSKITPIALLFLTFMKEGSNPIDVAMRKNHNSKHNQWNMVTITTQTCQHCDIQFSVVNFFHEQVDGISYSYSGIIGKISMRG
jgi:hypothetical protein